MGTTIGTVNEKEMLYPAITLCGFNTAQYTDRVDEAAIAALEHNPKDFLLGISYSYKSAGRY